MQSLTAYMPDVNIRIRTFDSFFVGLDCAIRREKASLVSSFRHVFIRQRIARPFLCCVASVALAAVVPAAASAAVFTARGPASAPGARPALSARAQRAVAAAADACTRLVAVKPTAHFNPAKATPAQLNAHGLPAAPARSDSRLYATWERYISMWLAGKARIVEPCSSRETLPSTGIRHSLPTNGPTTWAGYLVHHQTFTDVEATWVVPAATGTGLSSHWVGIGLGQSKTYPLVQAGEESDANGSAYGWVETVYAGEANAPEIPVPGLSGITGHTLGVHVHFGTDGSTSIHLVDETTGRNYYPNAPTYSGMKDDGHAEIISEDPNNQAQPMANFGEVIFTGCEAASAATGWKEFDALDDYTITMTDYLNNVMANPGPMSSGLFINYWDRAT